MIDYGKPSSEAYDAWIAYAKLQEIPLTGDISSHETDFLAGFNAGQENPINAPSRHAIALRILPIVIELMSVPKSNVREALACVLNAAIQLNENPPRIETAMVELRESCKLLCRELDL